MVKLQNSRSFAACCLNARRLAERGVRNIQIFHRGWDAHGNLPREHESQCKDIDQGCAALIKDLKQRGMLEDTLVVWVARVWQNGLLSRKHD